MSRARGEEERGAGDSFPAPRFFLLLAVVGVTSAEGL